jgi:hypothetical protein
VAAPGRAGKEVATLSEVRDVVWADGQTPIGRDARIQPGALRCVSGTLKLAFDSGALVTLEGPANLNVVSETRIRALRGRITTRVDDQFKGFAIETPNTLVVDLGTEFGVEVDDSGRTGVVVFEGQVDLSRSDASDSVRPIKRLSQGEAMRVGRTGRLSRIVAVERRPGNDEWTTRPSSDRDAVIRIVRDNIRGLSCSKYYQIVHRGLYDDVPAYVDRPHEWNGVDTGGFPDFLRGADYIMPFNDDKRMTDLQITVETGCPATLFVFFDDRAAVPSWLVDAFVDTGFDIGQDEGPIIPNGHKSTKRGSGVSIDAIFSVWKRDLEKGQSVRLGAMNGSAVSMYGIAAVPRS